MSNLAELKPTKPLLPGETFISVRIPHQTGHRFHGKVDRHSTAKWTLIPAQTGQ